MLERVVRTARQVCGQVLVLGKEGAPPGWPVELFVHFVPDPPQQAAVGSRGPMPALIAALVQTGAAVMLLACDMPLLKAETLRLLMEAHQGDGRADATIATSGEGVDRHAEPALAIYTPALLPALRNLLHHQRGSFQPLLHHPNVQAWSVPLNRRHELLNVNDEATLAKAERQMALGSAGS